MAYINEEQRRRWTRNNADLYIRHDAERFFLPGRCPEEFKPRHLRNSVDRSVSQPAEDSEPFLSSEELDALERERLMLQYELGKLRTEFELLKFEPSAQKAGFNPEQLRDDIGRWSDNGERRDNAATATALEVSAVRRRKNSGHHYMPRGVYQKWNLPEETRKVFDNATSGRLNIRGHFWDGANGAHGRYNAAVQELADRLIAENNIQVEQMTRGQARALLNEIASSQEPRIRDYNIGVKLLRRLYRLRTGGRGTE
jgi:hypothetical protein